MSDWLPPQWGSGFRDEWLRSMRGALTPFADFTSVFKEAMRPLQDALAAVTRDMQRSMAGISETMRPILDRLERYPGICMEFGWPPFDVPLSVVTEVVGLYDQKGDEARADIDALFVRLISRRALRDLGQEWSECHLMRRRAHILDAVMRAHARRDYALTVPALLASIEGVIADLHVPKGRMLQTDVKRFLTETFASEDAPERWSSQLNEATRSVIVDVMVGGFVHGDPAPKEVRRNAILHGADVDYATEANSLKAILMLDLVAEQYGYVALIDSDVYHRQACSTLRKSAKLGRHYKTTTSAGRAGKRPCGVCHPDERVASRSHESGRVPGYTVKGTLSSSVMRPPRLTECSVVEGIDSL